MIACKLLRATVWRWSERRKMAVLWRKTGSQAGISAGSRTSPKRLPCVRGAVSRRADWGVVSLRLRQSLRPFGAPPFTQGRLTLGYEQNLSLEHLYVQATNNFYWQAVLVEKVRKNTFPIFSLFQEWLDIKVFNSFNRVFNITNVMSKFT